MTPETTPPLVRRIRRPDWPEEREVVLVGTAHISPDSLRLVRETIESERPDGVCIELDGDRYQALMNPKAIERLDLKQVVRERKLLPLLAGVALGAWQARMGLRLGVEPGAELRGSGEDRRRSGGEGPSGGPAGTDHPPSRLAAGQLLAEGQAARRGSRIGKRRRADERGH